jgi:hypothetical protein
VARPHTGWSGQPKRHVYGCSAAGGAPAGEHRGYRRDGHRRLVSRDEAVVGGFAIVDVPSREGALGWAAKFAVACRCAEEVREIMFDPLR